MVTRRYCQKCGTYQFMGEAEQRAILAAEQQQEAAEAVSPDPQLNDSFSEPITFGGHVVNAPGFTADQFERAIARALIDELVIHEAAGYWLVCHRGVNGGYHVTRHTCDCKAGEHGQPCKHRAALCFHLDVREPALRHQWAEARQAVA